ncbi:MAG: hypothetical protein ACD_62C00549G0006 [uncultured bacterium]|nr:MAG: hypothetical protein ACD_62C00549G0006 [uncultured bacterium]HLD44539.1 hypothetical protein [bacterium]
MTKKFDCVDMKHIAAKEIYKETKDMTLEQELEYWTEQANELRKLMESKKKKSSQTTHITSGF